MNQIYSNIKAKIRPYWVTAFVSCMVIGLLTYGYLMSNHFLTHDSMWNLYSDQNMITSGRQFLQFACGISSYYDLPWFNGLLAIFYLTSKTLNIKQSIIIKSIKENYDKKQENGKLQSAMFNISHISCIVQESEENIKLLFWRSLCCIK